MHQIKQQKASQKVTEVERDDIINLLCRFVVNIPESERSLNRLIFHIEQAHWYYTDFLKKSYIDFHNFADNLLCYLPFFKDLQKQIKGIPNFKKYLNKIKGEISVFGAIIINKQRDKILMVTGPNKAYYGYSYGFPKGKINENESGIQCAIREVWEEIGFNCEQYISEDNCITYMPSQEKVNKFYIVDGVDENTNFKTQVRNEIEKIEWIKIDDIKKSKGDQKLQFQKILKFIAALEKWIENINEQSEKNNAFTKKENFIRQKMNNQFQIDRYNEFKKLLEVQAKGFSQLFEPKNEYLIVPVKQDNMTNNPFDEFKLDTEKLNNIFFQ